MKRYHPIPLSWLLIFLTSCTFSPATGITTPTEEINTPTGYHIVGVNDGGFLSLDPCGPPCFYGITPGITTDAQFDDVMNGTNSVFKNCKSSNNPYLENNERIIICNNVIGIGFVDQIVDGISFTPSVNISIQEVIDLYGFPNLVQTTAISSRSNMTLYYNQIQTVIRLVDQVGTEYSIRPETHISTIAYSTESAYQSLKQLAGSTGISWQGFGIYPATLLP